MNKLDSVLGALSWTILILAISNSFHVLTFVLSYYIFYYPLEACFPRRDIKELDADVRARREKLGRVEGGEDIIRIYYMRENTHFQ